MRRWSGWRSKPVSRCCEWPLGTGPEQSQKLAALAQARGVPNFVCLQDFASPGALAMRALPDGETIGKLLSVRMAGMFNPWGATFRLRAPTSLTPQTG
jgi:predicted dehydrogenase